MHAALEKLGYRFVGKNKHSAVKICEWCRNAIRFRDGNERELNDAEDIDDQRSSSRSASRSFCYKQKFYGIKSHRCLQMSPAAFWCSLNCLHCWRTLRFKAPRRVEWDEPKEILDESINAQRKLLEGFWGSECDKKKLREAMQPNHVAISLIGEPCFYPKLPELVKEIKSRNMTAYVVSNGTVPAMIERLTEHQPTNMYITLPAPNEKIYEKACLPLVKNGWKNIMKSLSLLREFDRSVIRLTLARGLNFVQPEKYAEIINESEADFIEVKSFMSVGGARERLPYNRMPLHTEIKEFAEKIEKHSSYRIINEKADSRVVLLKK